MVPYSFSTTHFLGDSFCTNNVLYCLRSDFLTIYVLYTSPLHPSVVDIAHAAIRHWKHLSSFFNVTYIYNCVRKLKCPHPELLHSQLGCTFFARLPQLLLSTWFRLENWTVVPPYNFSSLHQAHGEKTFFIVNVLYRRLLQKHKTAPHSTASIGPKLYIFSSFPISWLTSFLEDF